MMGLWSGSGRSELPQTGSSPTVLPFGGSRGLGTVPRQNPERPPLCAPAAAAEAWLLAPGQGLAECNSWQRGGGGSQGIVLQR